MNRVVKVEDFQKVVLRRKDIIKYEEQATFRDKSGGLYVKVYSPNDGRYIVGEIEEFV